MPDGTLLERSAVQYSLEQWAGRGLDPLMTTQARESKTRSAAKSASMPDRHRVALQKLGAIFAGDRRRRRHSRRHDRLLVDLSCRHH